MQAITHAMDDFNEMGCLAMFFDSTTINEEDEYLLYAFPPKKFSDDDKLLSYRGVIAAANSMLSSISGQGFSRFHWTRSLKSNLRCASG